jgi:hypothetical protein
MDCDLCVQSLKLVNAFMRLHGVGQALPDWAGHHASSHGQQGQTLHATVWGNHVLTDRQEKCPYDGRTAK